MLLFIVPAEVAQPPKPTSVLLGPSQSPFAQMATLRQVHQAVAAQRGPCIPELAQAWTLYKKLHGSWMPNAPKPKIEDVAALDALKATLEDKPLPDWFLTARKKQGQAMALNFVFDPQTPAFESLKQTPETERIKALGIVYLTEHELNREGAADKAGVTLTCLESRTALDHELHQLLARLYADARMSAPATQEITMALYLNPQADRNDLEFAAFILLGAKGKEAWSGIQSLLREASANSVEADAVIQNWSARLRKDLKFTNSPMTSAPH